MTENQNGARAALLAMAFTTLSSSASSPMLASIGEAFPQVPSLFLSMLSTVPSLICIPVAFLCGRLAGKAISFRFLILSGMLCTLISGVGPCFSQSFFSILLWRCLFGCGLGAVLPLLNALTLLLFEKDQAKIQAGNNTMSTNIGAIVFQLGAGFLCGALHWRYAFLIYLLVLPCTLIAWRFLQEPKQVQTENPPSDPSYSRKALRPLYKWCLVYFLYCLLFYSLVTETSAVIMERGFGTSGEAGIVLSLFTVGGVVGGFFYRKISHLKNILFALAFGWMAAGFLVMILSGNLYFLTIGEIMVGLGFGLFVPAVTTAGGLCVPVEYRAKATSTLVIFSNLGSFLSAFFMSAVSRLLEISNILFPFWVSFWGFSALTLFFLAVSRKTNWKIGKSEL